MEFPGFAVVHESVSSTKFHSVGFRSQAWPKSGVFQVGRKMPRIRAPKGKHECGKVMDCHHGEQVVASRVNEFSHEEIFCNQACQANGKSVESRGNGLMIGR
jgi:hypothetical protein